MKITWIGHSCFKIESQSNNGEIASILMDPYEDNSVPGLKPLREAAGKVICSHNHFDHNAAALIEKADCDLSIFSIEQIETYHDDNEGRDRGTNLITVIEADGTKVAHMGDIGCQLTAEQVSELRDLDCIMIPVGGTYTVDAEGAARIVKAIAPRTIIPMHYRSDELHFGFDNIDVVTTFAEDMSALGYNISVTGANSIEVKKTNSKTIYIFEPRDLIAD